VCLFLYMYRCECLPLRVGVHPAKDRKLWVRRETANQHVWFMSATGPALNIRWILRINVYIYIQTRICLYLYIPIYLLHTHMHIIRCENVDVYMYIYIIYMCIYVYTLFEKNVYTFANVQTCMLKPRYTRMYL
jgi:hypothetical protein